MNNVNQLLIRACKSRDPHARVRSVYRRFYLMSGSEQERTIALSGILTGIVDKFCPMTSCELINELGPSRDWLCPECNYYERALRVLISRIRLSKASCFIGLIAPARFRAA